MEGPFPNIMIRASAGTGKTFQLSNRFLALLSSGVQGHQILATTFTRKAAGEILDRVLSRLARAALDAGEAEQLSTQIADESLSCEKCQALLASTVADLHRLRVETLDSFFIQIARSFSLELDLPPAWSITDQHQDSKLRSAAIELVVHAGTDRDLPTMLNLMAKGEAQSGITRLIEDAVNDTYETYVESNEAAWSDAQHPVPLNELELAEVIESLRTVEVPNKHFENARRKDYDLAIAGEWDTMLLKGLAQRIATGEQTYYRRQIPADMLEIYERLLVQIRATVVGRTFSQTEATYQLLDRFHESYQRIKRESRALRFTDVTRRLAEQFTLDTSRSKGDRERAQTPNHVSFRLDGQVRHLLLDEFQDTSPAQWSVLRPFARHAASGAGSLLCVGDAKQAIYGWRGGAAEIFEAMADELPDLEQEALQKSYRSSPPVIDAVNRIFTGIHRHENLHRYAAPITRWSATFLPHETERADLTGCVSLETAPQAEAGESARETVYRHAARRLAELHRQAPHASIGALVRNNSAVGQLIYLLRTEGVPASEEGGNPLTDSAAVLLILSTLKLADHPGDTIARFHVANSPLGQQLGLDQLDDPAAALRVAAGIRQQLVEDGYGPTISRWCRIVRRSCNLRELSRMEQLLDLAYAYNAQATLRTSDFIDFVQSQPVADPAAARIRVMTIHQAKGLEFDIVVLADLEHNLVQGQQTLVVGRSHPTAPIDRVCRYAGQKIQQLMPRNYRDMFTAATARSVSESLCVLYVAVTRAVHALYMIIAPSAPQEQTMPLSYAGLLRASLEGTQMADPESVLFQIGDSDWASRQAAPVTATDADDQPLPAQIQLAAQPDARKRGLERSSPSQMEGGGLVRLNDVFAVTSNEARYHGTLAHAFFEQIVWLDDGPPSDTRLRQITARLQHQWGDQQIDTNNEIANFHRLLEQPTTRSLLRREEYAGLNSDAAAADRLEVFNECPIACHIDQHMISGCIDRLVLLFQNDQVIGADIIDYKTDFIEPRDATLVEAKVAFYWPQLEAYRQAVAAIYHLPLTRIAARLVLLSVDRVVSI